VFRGVRSSLIRSLIVIGYQECVVVLRLRVGGPYVRSLVPYRRLVGSRFIRVRSVRPLRGRLIVLGVLAGFARRLGLVHAVLLVRSRLRRLVLGRLAAILLGSVLRLRLRQWRLAHRRLRAADLHVEGGI